MSGQFRVSDAATSDEHPHLRFDAAAGRRPLAVLPRPAHLRRTGLGPPGPRHRRASGGTTLARPHRGRPLRARFRVAQVAAAIRRRHSEIKRVLLDQSVVSGIGNIYADEALWLARVHPAGSADLLSPQPSRRAARRGPGGDGRGARARGAPRSMRSMSTSTGPAATSGAPCDVYGREDPACHRCGAPIRRLHFMNRSSFVCPRCQRPPQVRARPR